jgi:hypothetical protein
LEDVSLDNDQLPPIHAARLQQARKASHAQSSPAAKPSSVNDATPGTPKDQSVRSAKSIPAVKHLGLRYNLLLVIDKSTSETMPVDSDRVFQPGDCVQLDLETNHSGYLYVLGRGSSGTWKALLPSPEMPDESNVVRSRTPVRVPVGYCYQVESPPGEEHIFVVLSRNPAELLALDDSIRNSSASATPAGELHQVTAMMTTENRLSDEVNKLQSILERRDLKIAKIGQPKDSKEPPGSVYVVNASDASPDNLVTEIKIRHQ